MSEDEGEFFEAIEEAPPPTNPLDSLPESPFDLESWKAVFTQNVNRSDAVKYFWDNFENEGYSMWSADYKYNDELGPVFMSTNLMSGFVQRLDPCRKYSFGSLILFSNENNTHQISGMFIIRGQEMPEIFIDVPDYECYTFTKLDTEDEETRRLWDYFIIQHGELDGKQFVYSKILK
eukprot:TRINITY_DN4071_c0_g2_i1.p1 TRINITY_DN4071_c0_g2~~TRINITY_DN4071_c0_g2_i1.p1  ORF type:complete len:177 (+),score=36.03 TRINITY_DN4071_c0_g2_i1:114-644(+)